MRLPAFPICLALLRWLALTGGALVCVGALARDGAKLPPTDVLCLGVLLALLGLRSVVMKRGAGGRASLYQISGESLVVIALLRDGPCAALAVKLLAGALLLPLERADYRAAPLRCWSNFFYFPALYFIAGSVYVGLGGQPLRAPADSAAFFQFPLRHVLPLLAALLVMNEVIHRPYMALILRFKDGESIRRTLRDPMFSCFDYLDCLGGAMILTLWTAWGWGTIPFTVGMQEAAMLGARGYFEKREAERAANCDALTGLASWRGLDDWLGRRIQSPHAARPFALLFLDVDGLKRVNDSLGHAAGNELLALVGECCRLHARAQDMVGRRGGDEFLVILDELGRTEARQVMARLQQAVADTIAVHPQLRQMGAGASVGLAMFPEDACDAGALIGLADRQMYADKRARKCARHAPLEHEKTTTRRSETSVAG